MVRELGSPPHAWKAPRYLDETRLAGLCPVPREVFDAAVRETLASAGKPNFGYFVGVLETEKRKAAQGSTGPPGRNGSVGYHPGSKTFGEGDQRL